MSPGERSFSGNFHDFIRIAEILYTAIYFEFLTPACKARLVQTSSTGVVADIPYTADMMIRPAVLSGQTVS